MSRKICIFPNDPLIEYYKKGEIKEEERIDYMEDDSYICVKYDGANNWFNETTYSQNSEIIKKLERSKKHKEGIVTTYFSKDTAGEKTMEKLEKYPIEECSISSFQVI